jgi:hypothetical protein
MVEKSIIEKLEKAGVPVKERREKPLYNISLSVRRGVLEIDTQADEYETERIPIKYLGIIERVMKENGLTKKGITISPL